MEEALGQVVASPRLSSHPSTSIYLSIYLIFIYSIIRLARLFRLSRLHAGHGSCSRLGRPFNQLRAFFQSSWLAACLTSSTNRPLIWKVFLFLFFRAELIFFVLCSFRLSSLARFQSRRPEIVIITRTRSSSIHFSRKPAFAFSQVV